MASFMQPSNDPPKQQMEFFAQLANLQPSETDEFRRLLWTGLYSQLIIMTVPVNGDIDEEIKPQLFPSFSRLFICS